jgi:RND superfamily putative drug exporter
MADIVNNVSWCHRRPAGTLELRRKLHRPTTRLVNQDARPFTRPPESRRTMNRIAQSESPASPTAVRTPKEGIPRSPDSSSPARAGLLTRLGTFCVRRRRLILLAWLGLFVTGILIGGEVFTHLKESNGSSSAESVHGFNLVAKVSTRGGSMVAVIDGARVSDPAVGKAVVAAAHRVSKLTGVTGVVTAYDSTDPRLRSADGRASLMLVQTAKTTDMVVSHREVADVRAALADAVPGATVKVGGDLAVMHDQMMTSESDLMKGEGIAIPILLLALLLVFRGFRPALIPILGGLVTVSGALLLLLGITKFIDVSFYAVDVIALFGIALAVDYSLLMVNRFREERGAGHDVTAAVARSVGAAGRTITFSALTVIASLAGLFVFNDPTFSSLAVGGIATTLIALLAGLVLVPALLAVLGRKIKAETRSQATDGLFGRLARRVQRRPLVVACAAAGVLLAAGIPFLSVNFGQDDPRILPRSFESRTVADTLLARFPDKAADPIQIVAQRAATDPAVLAYAEKIKTIPGVTSVTINDSLPGNLSVTNVMGTGSTQSASAQNLVAALRADRPAYRTYVSGSAAFLMDFKHNIASRLPWALALIAMATFALLFLMTGSVLVPIKALVMNALSLGATFGALVWIFQEGHLSGLLGFDAFGAIEVWVPVVVFVFAFGLSMDYEVFLLSRIKEAYDECGDSNQAVARGMQRSGRIITSAAALVMIVFLGFALGDNLGIKQMGLALAIAVLVDATLVRCLLVPATMTLLGKANWWAPAPLRRLHDRFALNEAPPAAVTNPSSPPRESDVHTVGTKTPAFPS